MINAQEARKMTEENQHFPLFWQEVDKKVRKAASAGQDRTLYEPDFVLTKDVFCQTIAPKLRELGFKAAYFPGLNSVNIMW